MNATGGWTAIDEELDPDSTNPVQNKTLYNLETYHNVFVDLQNVRGVKTAILYIRNGNKTIDLSKVKNFESIKCIATDTLDIYNYLVFENFELKVRSDNTYKNIYTCYREGVISSLSGATVYTNKLRPVITQVTLNNRIGENKNIGLRNIAFTSGATFEIVKMDGEYYIVDDPVLIRYSNIDEKSDENGGYLYKYKREGIAYASGLKKQWFSGIDISENGQKIYFPIKMTTTDYSIVEARKGSNLADVTGYVEKQLEYFEVNPENDHTADFFVIGY